MKRLYSLGLLASVLLGSSLWTGCGSSNNVTPPPPQAAAQFAFIRYTGGGSVAPSLKAARMNRMTPRERLAMQKAAVRRMSSTAAASGDYSLYTMKVDGTAETLVPNSSAFDYFSVALSPDAKKIVFDAMSSATNYQNVNIYLMNVDGTNLTPLTTDAEGDSTEPRFTSDGKSVFYMNYPANGGASQVWTYDLPLQEKEQITDMANLSFWAPNSSADGTMGVAMAYDASTGLTNIYTVKVDTGAVTQVTTGDNWDYYFWPTFTPDGKKIVVTAWLNDGDMNKDDLVTMNLDGTGVASLTDVENGTYADSANIVGQKLVYQQWGSNQANDLYAMNPDGTGVKQLTSNSVDDVVDLYWLWEGY